jgi:hypothetical protein
MIPTGKADPQALFITGQRILVDRGRGLGS